MIACRLSYNNFIILKISSFHPFSIYNIGRISGKKTGTEKKLPEIQPDCRLLNVLFFDKIWQIFQNSARIFLNFGCNFKGIIIQYAMYNEFYDLDQRLACKAIDPQGAR